eukprot:11210199-Lingulodinium_polyedra.AAC.1
MRRHRGAGCGPAWITALSRRRANGNGLLPHRPRPAPPLAWPRYASHLMPRPTKSSLAHATPNLANCTLAGASRLANDNGR